VTNADDRLDRIERFLEEAAKNLAAVTKKQDEMAARQHYHDEAFERQDAELKRLRDMLDIDAENIRALARIAELHHERMNRLEGGEQLN
jgi:uncharacterized protein YozE (UPF0346 family)